MGATGEWKGQKSRAFLLPPVLRAAGICPSPGGWGQVLSGSLQSPGRAFSHDLLKTWSLMGDAVKRETSDTYFPFQPRRLRERLCSCVLSATRCSSSDRNCIQGLCCLMPKDSGSPALSQGILGCLVPSVVPPCQRTQALAAPPAGAGLGADPGSSPCSVLHRLFPTAEHCPHCPITAAAPLAWQLLRSHSLQRLHPALSSPRAWLCDGGTILPLSALTPTFWEGQSGVGALSQPPQWALCGVTVLGIKSDLCLHSQEM